MNKFNKDASFFKLICRRQLEELVKKWGIDKGARYLSTWELTNAPISCYFYGLVLRLCFAALFLSGFAETENISFCLFGFENFCSHYF